MSQFILSRPIHINYLSPRNGLILALTPDGHAAERRLIDRGWTRRLTWNERRLYRRIRKCWSNGQDLVAYLAPLDRFVILTPERYVD